MGRFEVAEGNWETEKLGEFGRQGENLNWVDTKSGSGAGRWELVKIKGKTTELMTEGRENQAGDRSRKPEVHSWGSRSREWPPARLTPVQT